MDPEYLVNADTQDSGGRETKGFSCGRNAKHEHSHDCCLCFMNIKERETRLTQSADGGTYIQVYVDPKRPHWPSTAPVGCTKYVNEDLQKQLKDSCSKGDVAVTEQLISVGADPNYCNSEGTLRPSVYYASRYGHIVLLRKLIEKYRCNVQYKTPRGTTLLHVACLHGYEEIVTYLATGHRLDPSARTKHGSTPLHLACIGGHPQIVQFLIENLGCDPKCSAELDETPLHTACTKGHLAIMKYLIRVHHCNPNQPTRVGGETTLHLACQHGFLEIVRYLILDQHCNANAKDFFQNTPLHSAAQQNHPDIVHYLVHDQKCSPEARNRDNCTPLHLASKYGRIDVVRVLLEGGANPSIPGPGNLTPIQLATNHEVIKLLIRHGASPLETQVKVVFPSVSLDRDPQDTIIRAMVVGDPATGKSTLVEALKQTNTGKWYHQFMTSSIKVEPFTAGIVPHELKNSEFGHTILFDFAGQSDYYTSHAVVIDCTSIAPAPIFIVVVDLSKDVERIQLRLNFWIWFIENNKPASVSVPHIFVVGSHYDILQKQDHSSRQEKLRIVKDFAEYMIRKTSLHFRGFFPLNCQKIANHEELRKSLQRSCQSLRSHVPDDTLGHVLSVYLFALFKGDVMCTVKELADLIRKNDWSFPYSTDKLCELCERLGSKVNIMFIKNKVKLEESTIILDVDTLLRRINGVMFAPKSSEFPQPNLESRNGIVTFSKLKKVFSDLNPRVVAECMQRLEFCHAIHDQGTLELIKGSNRSLNREISCDVETDGINDHPEEYFFFPSLINVREPVRIWREIQNPHTYYTGWCLQCSERFQGFSARLMHTILIRTAFTFAVDCNDLSVSESHRGLKRECNLWNMGIHWFNLQGIENYLELREDGQVIVLVMRCFKGHEMECVKLRSAIIQNTLEAVKEFSPNIKTEEGLLDPRYLANYPLPSIKQLEVPFYSIEMILKPLLGGNSSTFDKSKEHMILLEDLLFWDPYMRHGQLHKVLNDPEKQDTLLTDSFIFDVSQWFSHDWQKLAFIFQFETTTISNIQEAANNRQDLMCQYILQHYTRKNSNPTFKELKILLEEYSLLKGRNLYVRH